MRTKVTKRGQVSVPSEVRKKLKIRANTTLEWAIEGESFRYQPTRSMLSEAPVPKDRFSAF
jgi:AbrB family looped-hinge helix DNA binding protein